jgi:hypothetical protein
MKLERAAEAIRYCWKQVFGEEPPIEIRKNEILVDRAITFYREDNKSKQWSVALEIHIPGTREDPPDADVIDICQEQHFFGALNTALEYVANYRISNTVSEEANAFWSED